MGIQSWLKRCLFSIKNLQEPHASFGHRTKLGRLLQDSRMSWREGGIHFLWQLGGLKIKEAAKKIAPRPALNANCITHFPH